MRYHFHVWMPHQWRYDRQGEEFSSSDEAVESAEIAVREVVAQEIERGKAFPDGALVRITSGDGNIVRPFTLHEVCNRPGPEVPDWLTHDARALSAQIRADMRLRRLELRHERLKVAGQLQTFARLVRALSEKI